MELNEKILGIEVLLRDIRYDWRFNLLSRINTTVNLLEEVIKDDLLSDDMQHDFNILLEKVKGFRKDVINQKPWIDGRTFRNDFPYGYMGMNELHLLGCHYSEISEEFKHKIVVEVNYPEMSFSDC